MNSLRNQSDSTPKSSKSHKMAEDIQNELSDEDDSDSEDEEKRTMFCGNLNPKITEALLYELCLQAGPLEKVHIPKPKDGPQKNFGFATYQYSCSVPYAMDIFDGVTLFGQKVMFQHRNRNSRNGAEQERRKRMRGGDEQPQYQQQRFPAHNPINIQLQQQLAMAAQMGVDPNVLLQLSNNFSPPSFPSQLSMGGQQNHDLYKRTSQGDRARRLRDEREMYHRPNNNNGSWSGRSNHNQWNDRRSEQRRSGGGGNGNYR